MSDFDPTTIYRQVLAAGEDWADKKAAYQALEDVSKSVLAQQKGSLMDAGAKSVTEAEMRALYGESYRAHLESLSAARSAWLHAQVRYESLKMLAELRRSEESSKRAEMRMV